MRAHSLRKASAITVLRGSTNELLAMALRRQMLLNGTAGVQQGNQTRYAFSNSPAPPPMTNFNPDSPDVREHDGWTATSSEETDDEGSVAFAFPARKPQIILYQVIS